MTPLDMADALFDALFAFLAVIALLAAVALAAQGDPEAAGPLGVLLMMWCLWLYCTWEQSRGRR